MPEYLATGASLVVRKYGTRLPLVELCDENMMGRVGIQRLGS